MNGSFTTVVLLLLLSSLSNGAGDLYRYCDPGDESCSEQAAQDAICTVLENIQSLLITILAFTAIVSAVPVALAVLCCLGYGIIHWGDSDHPYARLAVVLSLIAPVMWAITVGVTAASIWLVPILVADGKC